MTMLALFETEDAVQTWQERATQASLRRIAARGLLMLPLSYGTLAKQDAIVTALKGADHA